MSQPIQSAYTAPVSFVGKPLIIERESAKDRMIVIFVQQPIGI